jgi:hypothetical protein
MRGSRKSLRVAFEEADLLMDAFDLLQHIP